MRRWTSLCLLPLLSCTFLRAEPAPTRQKAVIERDYHGGFPDDFPALLTQVQTMVPLAQFDVSSQLGFLQYKEGFLHPVSIRFTDGAPLLVENPIFYAQAAPEGAPFRQDLFANVEAFVHRRDEDSASIDRELKQTFSYAMTRLILDDLAGGQTNRQLPLWVEEGVSVYISGMGEDFVRKVGGEVTRSHVKEQAEPLNRPFPVMTRRQWARYYLGIKYIVSAGGTSALQAVMRNLLNGKSAADSIRDVLGQEWPDFQDHVQAYSVKAFEPFTQEDTQPVSQTSPR